MTRSERRQRFSLTLLMAVLFFLLQLISVLLAMGVVLLLVHAGLIASVQEENLSLSYILFFMSLISLIAGTILSMLTGKYYTKPINRFVQQMNRLASGDFKARIHFGKPMSYTAAFRQIQDGFNTAAAELEQTQMLRSDFVNNFSHEFKTPIVSIAGFAKLLQRGDLTPQQQQEYLAIIEEESLRLANMATEVLDLTRIENQAILTDVSTFHVTEQIRAAILLLENKWTAKNLEFNLHMDECMICANEELLRHVWINLLDNAIKYSEDYGVVDVLVTQGEKTLQAAISNTGKPIPPESIKRIFDKFYQADESHASLGSGIGLAVVKKAVQLHQGTVQVQSTPALTTFTVTLPLQQPVA